MDYGFKERLRGKTPEELVALLNREVGNPGWVTARGFFLIGLRDAFLESGLDCSSFITNGQMKVMHVKLEGHKVVPVATAPPEPNTQTALQLEDLDDQSLVDGFVRALAEGDTSMADALGPELAARGLGDLVDDEMGILRPFDELEDDLDLVFRLLDPKPDRADAIESGGSLTEEEFSRFEDAVGEQCFQADGTNEAWAVLSVVSSGGKEAFVAVTIAGGSTDGTERDFVDGFLSLPEAKAALKQRGYLDPEDFRQRFRSRRA